MYRFTILLAIFLWTTLPFHAHEKYEVRATWITTLGGLDWPSYKANSPQSIKLQKEELCTILDKLKAAHFNTILFQTRLRGDVIYPSQFETFSECLTGRTGKNPGYDPLQFAIEECHKRGMDLHAWVVTIPVGSKRQVKLLGKQSIVAKRPSICKQFNGNWYLDPGHPETVNYLSKIVREIVTRYDIDGLHFDYIRYPEHGKNFPDMSNYKRYGRKKPLNQWRRENISRIVRHLYAEIKAIKPWVIVSSSPVGKFNDTRRYTSQGWNAYEEVYQDAQGWLKEGIHDALFPMMYFRHNHFYPFALDWQENKNERWIVPGLGIYFLQSSSNPWKLDDVLKQIHFTRTYSFEGQAYFRNQFLMKNAKGILDELHTNLYTHPTVTPPLRWMNDSVPAPPSIVFFNETDDKISIQWNHSATQKEGGIFYRIYASDTYPVDITKGKNLIANRIKDTQFCYIPQIAWMQKMFWAITAVDRYGNESIPVACNKPQKFDFKLYENSFPEIPEGCTLIISDATGKEVMRINHTESQQRINLDKGFYRISLVEPNGNIKLIGTLLR